MGNDERLCKCTVPVLVGSGLNLCRTNVVVSCLGTAGSPRSSWGWGLQTPAGVAEHFWPRWALAQIHVSMTLHFILYMGELNKDVAWLVAYLCAPQTWK